MTGQTGEKRPIKTAPRGGSVRNWLSALCTVYSAGARMGASTVRQWGASARGLFLLSACHAGHQHGRPGLATSAWRGADQAVVLEFEDFRDFRNLLRGSVPFTMLL